MQGPLPRLPVFEGFRPDELHMLAPLFEECRYPAGSSLFAQGEPARFLFLVIEGLIEIYYKPYDGPALTVGTATTGGAVGWSAVVGSQSYTSSAVVQEDAHLLRVAGDDLRRLCNRSPELARRLLDRLAQLVSGRWQNARHQVESMLREGIHPSRPRRQTMMSDANAGREEQVRRLIEQLSAYVEQFHGGSVEFVSLQGNTLRVKLGGACLGCPLSPSTLHGWVAGTVRQFFPEMEVVAAE